MPLLDHFHPPLSGARHWESFHATWAGSIADSLNRDLLPPGYFAEEHVHVGSRVEVDVGTFEEHDAGVGDGSRGGTATAATWTAPAPTSTWPAVFPDSVEVLVYSGEAGPTLVAAVELISPGNKDRPAERRAFAAKCAAYLQQGIGLVVVDVVTSRSADLHAELASMVHAPATEAVPARLYAAADQPIRSADASRSRIDVWSTGLSVGQPLPELPLALDKGRVVPLDLDSSYAVACERRRIPSFPRPAV
jgi:hypothetical protein